MSHRHHDHAPASGAIGQAFFLNLFFTLIELAGGLWTGSYAILSDAVHDLGDSVSLGLAWAMDRLARRTRTPNYSYGYKRFSLVAAFANSVVLIAGAVFVLAGALPRLFNPVMPDTGGMLLIAVLGVAFNGMAVLRARRGKSLNEQVVTWHLLEDVIGWIAVLVGALLMRWFDLPLLDPLLSIGISLFILWNVARKLHEVLRLFLQGTPAGVTTAQVAALLTAPPDVTDAHDIHCWSMDGAYHVLSAHLVVGDGVTPDRAHAIKTEVRAALHDLGIEHATLEIERGGEECEGGC